MEEQQSLTKKEKRALAKEKKREERLKKEKTKKRKNWIIGLFVLIALFAAGARFWRWINTPTQIPQEIFEVSENDWVKGSPNAKMTLIEYADFQCPACAAYAIDTKKLAEEFPDDLRVVFRHFPLVSIHKNAIPAAKATEAAGMQGKFWEMHDKLFEKQKDWEEERSPNDKFIFYAKELGLDEDKFKNDLGNKDLEKKINNDLLGANQLRLNATPTFYLNGERIKTPRDYNQFRSIIEEAIGKSR